MTLFTHSFLPAPSAPTWDRDEERAKEKASRPSTAVVSATKTAPPYGQRKGWIPRVQDDFGDGGAYPGRRYLVKMIKNDSDMENVLILNFRNPCGTISFEFRTSRT